jgi:uncharacterized membrane protein
MAGLELVKAYCGPVYLQYPYDQCNVLLDLKNLFTRFFTFSQNTLFFRGLCVTSTHFFCIYGGVTYTCMEWAVNDGISLVLLIFVVLCMLVRRTTS